ncbi:SusF/SusE family outer membrane protein [Chryseobacterium arthrosphaerae]|uniref:SusF/SusE family outer membrane protein n=1 Tax=Chryseobacterium arthrosphaerae TaxID=651561 RepID=UPI0023E2C340|nr:SusF/SusE family outer membrane protein [Chryseobacterium arthrosphaerae]WES98031.1 SusF/SusE family outer membrane protein [Chryseobacterium arthrosphaerae]
MKNFFKILTVTAMGILFTACSKDEDQVILNETSQSKISADKTTVILDKNQLDKVAVNFNLVKSTFNIAIVSTQQIELDIKGNNFKKSKLIDVVNPTYSLTNKEFNTLMLALNGVVNVPNQIDVRLKTTIGSASFYSNVVTLAVTPYILGPTYNYTDLYLIGDATSAGWTNEATNTKFLPLQKTAAAGVYSYTGYFAKGGFKMIKTPGAWDPQYGMGAGAGILSTSGSSGDIKVDVAGYYKLTVNTNTLTYTISPTADPTVTYTTISMIGTASGDWNTDVDLQKSTFDPHIWVKKSVTMNAGEFKFRANHDWGTSWGVAQEFFGVAAVGGANIPLATSFKYDVYFNDITGEFSVIPVF